MTKKKDRTDSNTAAAPSRPSELRLAVDRFEATKIAVDAYRNSLSSWLDRVAYLEAQLREAGRNLRDVQGALSYHEDKLMRERSDVESLTYISTRKGPVTSLGQVECCEKVSKY